jgi:hypothetical protein
MTGNPSTTAERTVQTRPIPADDLAAAAAEFLRHPSARIFAIQAVVLAVVRAAMGGLHRRDATIAAAVVAWWPLQEWLAHRLILHAPARTIAGRRWDPAAARYHRAHHANPWDIGYTMLPMWVVLPALPLNALLWLVIAPTRRTAVTGMLASAAVALNYEWIHFLTHTAYRPRRSWFRRLQRRHRLHHFKNENLWLGFTVPYVDDLLGTAPDPATVPTSPTVRSLGVTDAA